MRRALVPFAPKEEYDLPMRTLFSAWLFVTLFLSASARAALLPVQGKDLVSGQSQSVSAGAKGTVVVFLSARCPCSNGHVPEIKKLQADFPGFTFVGVHSNGDEPADQARPYFKAAAFPFPLLSDEKFRLADSFRALKTPHAFVLSPEGAIVYQGGVTSSASGLNPDTHYLREVLGDIQAGKAPRRDRGRTLGCLISRSGG